MPKWIGKGVLNVDGKDYGYGKEIPKTIGTKKLKELIDAGNVGDIPEKINSKALQTDAIKSLEKDNAGLEKAVKSLERDKASQFDANKAINDENTELAKGINSLKESLDEYKKLVVEQKEAIKSLKAENAELKKK